MINVAVVAIRFHDVPGTEAPGSVSKRLRPVNPELQSGAIAGTKIDFTNSHRNLRSRIRFTQARAQIAGDVAHQSAGDDRASKLVADIPHG